MLGGCEVSIISGMVSELFEVSKWIVADRSLLKGVTCLWISFTALVSSGLECHLTGGVMTGNGSSTGGLGYWDCGKNS